MKTLLHSTLAIILILASLSVLNNSCTLIGLAIGSGIHKKDKDPYVVKPIEIQQLNPGRLLTIIYKDDRTIEGKYKGTSQISQEQFSEEYSRFLNVHPDELSLPAIGDTMEIYYAVYKITEKCIFLALETNSIIVDRFNLETPFYVPINSNEIFLYRNGKVFLPNNYADIPCLTAIKIADTAHNLLNISVNEIKTIKAHYRKDARLEGSLIGLGLDVAIISVLIYFSVNVY